MSPTLRRTGRVVGAALLGTTAAIHAVLYAHDGYRQIPKIGTMFLALVVIASLLCLATIAVPGRLLSPVAAAGALVQSGTLVGLVVFTHYTIFNFRESTRAPYYWDSVGVELAGFAVLAVLAAATFVRRRSPSR